MFLHNCHDLLTLELLMKADKEQKSSLKMIAWNIPVITFSIQLSWKSAYAHTVHVANRCTWLESVRFSIFFRFLKICYDSKKHIKNTHVIKRTRSKNVHWPPFSTHAHWDKRIGSVYLVQHLITKILLITQENANVENIGIIPNFFKHFSLDRWNIHLGMNNRSTARKTRLYTRPVLN